MRTDLRFLRATEDEIDNSKNFLYRGLVDSLMYLGCTARPEIMYAISYLAR